MKTVFADTAYWIAVFRPEDSWTAIAREARKRLGPARLITVDEVLVEFLAAVSAAGPTVRARAVLFILKLLAHPQVTVIPQSRQSFLEGLDYYGRRSDKNYSLTDCICMNAMSKSAIREVLTSDRHFQQEGFRVLMR